tara:strand:+ start:254 stop:514 length:261 start_codon:yes stop_codon:yes gene_type:complete
MCKNKHCFDDTCKGECENDVPIMKEEIPNIDPAEYAKSMGRMPRKFWQCQNASCAKVVPNPLRWVYATKTIFSCPYCRNPAVEIKP